jgi:hypothetical protein
MSNYFKIYWLTRLDEVHVLFLTLAALGFIAAIGIFLYKTINEDSVLGGLKTAIVIGIVFSLLSVFVPTEKEAILISSGEKNINLKK